MKLIRKQDKPQVQQKVQTVQNVPRNAKKHHSDPNALIPYGKYAQKTVKWVQQNDTSYWNWIEANNLVEEWGLNKQPQVEQIVFTNNTFYSRGYQWLGIRVIEHT